MHNLERPNFKEVIVVEGKDDVAAIKRACHAQTIITRGLGLTGEIIESIRRAQTQCGVIVLTDPDAPGEKIRDRIQKAVPGCRHAYLYRDRKGPRGPVGVEYASPKEILEALERAQVTRQEIQPEVYTLGDLRQWNLTGHPKAQARRDALGRILGLGQTNAKQFLNRLNAYGIAKDDFLEGLKILDRGDRKEHRDGK